MEREGREAARAREGRLAVLAAYDILDTPPEAEFDDLVQIACAICAAPIGLISFVDADRQWFKSRLNFGERQTTLDRSICVHGIGDDGLMIVPDLVVDSRTAASPMVVGDPAFRFYAGAPLRIASGETLGMLCVIDTTPRPAGLTTMQRDALTALARQVVAQLDRRRHLRESAALIEIGDRLRDCTTVPEITGTAAAIVGRSLHVARVGYGTVDAATAFVDVADDWTAPGIASIAGRHRLADFGSIADELSRGEPLVIGDVLTDPRTAAAPDALLALDIGALVNMPIRDRGRTVAVLIVHAATPRVWTPAEIAFLRNVADRVEAGVARLRAENRQTILNGELAHRLKNTLAIVQAIASQTLKTSADRAPIEAFEARLMALGAAHDVLLQTSWASADLRAVVDGALASFGDMARITIDGPPVTLASRAALSTALVVHELCTNAYKYGALSVAKGSVTLDWHFDATDGLVFTWREHGGPPAAEPTRRGFGSKLLRLGLVGTGGADLRYDHTGFSAIMRAPADELTQI